MMLLKSLKMECPNIKDCQLLKLKEDLGFIVVEKDFNVGEETLQQVQDRFSGVEPLRIVLDSDNSGLGCLYFRGVFLCDTLVNPDYVYLGEWKLKMSYSAKFKKFLPEFVVPNHSGLRFHAANTINDLKGCVGVGVRLENKPLLAYSTITLDRVIRIIKENDIRFLQIY